MTAKVQFKLGTIEFSGEGEEGWLATQLDKLLSNAPDLLKLAPAASDQDAVTAGTRQQGEYDEISQNVSLGAFLKTKNAGSSQVNRFLATAIWLTGRGNKTPSTSDVTKALAENHQPKLKNAADSLNQNVGKGFCEKKGKQFFVTPQGLESMR